MRQPTDLSTDAGPQPQFFVVGAQRSGTTLLRAMLSSHPQLAVPPESHFVVPLLQHRLEYERSSEAIDADRLVETLRDDQHLAQWGLPDGALEECCRNAPTVPDALGRLFARYAAERGRPLAGDKTAGYVEHVSMLAAAFPEARFVHLIRDGRDVAASLRQVAFGPSTLAAGAARWVRWVSAGRSQGQALGLSRYLELRYEDLVSGPESVLRETCGFLGLPYSDAMLEYHQDSELYLGQVLRPEAHRGLRHRPDPRWRDWRRSLSASQVGVVECVQGALLSELGYELARESPTLRARSLVTAHRYLLKLPTIRTRLNAHY